MVSAFRGTPITLNACDSIFLIFFPRPFPGRDGPVNHGIQFRRAATFLLGIFIMSIGVAITVHAQLGTAPITSFPTVLSSATSLSVGAWTILFCLVVMLIEVAVLGRRFPPIQLIQLPVVFVFGLFVDLSVALTTWIETDNYLLQWVWTLVGSVVVALGVYIEVQPRLTYLPPDGLVTAITMRSGLPFGRIKLFFDWTLVALAVITSLLLMGELQGVREGTAFAAIAVGYLVKVIGNIHTRLRVDRDRD